MSNLKFADIDEWTPSSISIVDEPAHPLCKFEVYTDDEEYVKKSMQINEGENMVEQDAKIETEQMVSGPVSFFKDLLKGNVAKAEEIPQPPAPKDAEEKEEKPDLEARVAKLEARLEKLEKAEEKPKEDEEKPAEDAVAKSESEGESEGETVTPEPEVVTKSLDPDVLTHSETEKSLVERAGRKINGMTW